MNWKGTITNCIACGASLKPVKDLAGGINKYWKQCASRTCNSFYNTEFIPMEHQLDILHQAELGGTVAALGGYGSAKTSTNGMAFLLHNLLISRGNSLLGANTWIQMVRTNMLEMAEITPAPLVASASITASEKNASYNVRYKNGHTVTATVLTDEEKIRSMNLTGAWIEEASVIKYSNFDQIQARLRHPAAKVYAKNEDGTVLSESFIDSSGIMRSRPKELKSRHLTLLSSNPDPGWLRTHLLFRTPENQVHYYGTDQLIRNSLIQNGFDKNANYHSFVIPSTANFHLPIDFLPNLMQGKSKRWIDRYINGSFSFNEGMVYDEALEHMVEPFEIPAHWRRMISTDFGSREATAHIVGAINPENGVLYLYDCFKLSNGTLSEFLDGFHRLYDPVKPSVWLYPPIGDPAGEHKLIDNMSWFKLYADNGIYMIPSKTGAHSELGIAAGIALVRDYFSAGKIKFFNNMTPFIDEIKNYRYKTESLMEQESESRKDERPVAYNDHLMDAFRGMVSMLPRDIGLNLGSFQPSFVETSRINSAFGIAISDSDNNEFDPSDDKFWSAKTFKDEYEFDNGIDLDDTGGLLY